MHGGRALRMEFARTMRNGRFFLAAVLIGVLCVASIWDQTGWWNIDRVQYVDINHTVSLMMQWKTDFEDVIYVAAAFPFVYGFCQEWRSGYWEPLEIRLGTGRYLLVKAGGGLLISFAATFLGLCLALLVLLVHGAVFDLPLVDELQYQGPPSNPMPDHVLLSWFLRFFLYSFSSMFWAAVAFLVAVWQPDYFLVAAIPIALNEAQEIILPRLISPVVMFQVLTDGFIFINTDDPYWFGVLFSAGMLACLTAVPVILAVRLLRKKVEHEYVS